VRAASAQVTELHAALDVLRKREDLMVREIRTLREDVAAAEQQLARAEGLLEEFGINSRPVGANDELALDAPTQLREMPGLDINGEIRATRSTGGHFYATVNVGRADGVTKGMRFNVVDTERSQFLGYLRIERVDDHEATGLLEGPNPAAISPGVQVMTQL
jgi:hypothetical protein